MRYFAAVMIVLAYVALCWIYLFKYRQRERLAFSGTAQVSQPSAILVTYASQTGQAERLARQSAEQLIHAGIAVTLLPLNKIDAQILARTERALFVVSTYGEGEAPDNGASFIRRYLSGDNDTVLTHLRFAILALGDRNYRHFCGFGHALDHGLHHYGATSLFDLVEVDKNDESALRHWQYYLGQLSGNSHFADWSRPGYSPWQLHSRRCLNPGSPGHPAFHIQLIPERVGADVHHWKAGDIAEIGPCNSPRAVEDFLTNLSLDGNIRIAPEDVRLAQLLLRRELPEDEKVRQALHGLNAQTLVQQLPELPHREYSIASLPEDGTLDLLVRQVKITDEKLGLGSGWLTAYAQPGDEIALRIRSNSRFHTPDDDRPLILIGNGTGLAGLRAHLRARAQQGRSRNWLFFGERTQANDFFFANEILEWKKTGHLAYLDLAFSRDQDVKDQVAPRYVQHLLMYKRNYLKLWIDDGAAIFVCGSLQGMAQGVDEALKTILGADTLEVLAEAGRYCRDVY